jgi:hypothetical protein
MNVLARFLIALTLLFALSDRVFARAYRSDDIFIDAGISTYERPRVPSDYTLSNDMFPRLPLMFDANADLFDGMHRELASNSADMLRPFPASTPDSPLFHRPD